MEQLVLADWTEPTWLLGPQHPALLAKLVPPASLPRILCDGIGGDAWETSCSALHTSQTGGSSKGFLPRALSPKSPHASHVVSPPGEPGIHAGPSSWASDPDSDGGVSWGHSGRYVPWDLEFQETPSGPLTARGKARCCCRRRLIDTCIGSHASPSLSHTHTHTHTHTRLPSRVGQTMSLPPHLETWRPILLICEAG